MIFILKEEEKDIEVFFGMVIKVDGIVVWNLDYVLFIIDINVLFFFIFVNNVVLKDIVIDLEVGVWGWLFLLELVIGDYINKLLFVVYYYGGGFCMGNVGNVLVSDCFFCFFLCYYWI